jgi:hypothetical protein
MDDVAKKLRPETLDQIVRMPVLTPDEIDVLQKAVASVTTAKVNLVPSVMRLGAEEEIYLLGASLEASQVTIRIDVPAFAVVRSFDVAGGLRLVEGALRDLPYGDILGGDRPFVVSVRLAPTLLPLRARWLEAARSLVENLPRESGR